MGEGRRLGRWAVVSQVGVVGLVVAAVGVLPAHAATVGCGSVLTANTTLTQDLSCGSGDGLVISTSGITLDLKGHTITGAGTATPAGIRITPGVTGVTVQKGAIVGFNTGVVADTTDESHITKLEVHAVDQGILLANATNALVDKNTVTGAGRDGIKVDGSDNTVTQNTVTDNTWGISVSNGGTGNEVSKNVLTGNRVDGIAVFDGAGTTLIEKNTVSGGTNGIEITGGAGATTVSKNAASGASQHGIWVQADTSGTLLSKNTSSGNGGDGIHVDSTDTTITKNTASGNTGWGIFAVSGVTDGGGNSSSGNGSPCAGVVCS